MKTLGIVKVEKRSLYPIGIYGPWKKVALIYNLLTLDGRDFYHAQCLTNVAAGTRGANVVALTESTFTPLTSDTSLVGEIIVNGLARASADTITHTNDTNSTTIQNTFTATGSFTDVKASALFNATTPPISGIMTHEANFGTGSGTLASGDQLRVTWTINIG